MAHPAGVGQRGSKETTMPMSEYDKRLAYLRAHPEEEPYFELHTHIWVDGHPFLRCTDGGALGRLARWLLAQGMESLDE
jgi:hypothetical protein